MKIRQLDYSSIINANSQMLGAKNAYTANQSSRFNADNIKAMDSIYAKQKSAIQHKRNAMNLNSWGNLVDSIMEAAEGAYKVATIYKNSKAEEESAAATTKYTELIGNFDLDAENLRKNGQMFDSEGNYTTEYRNLLDNYGKQIDSMGFSKMTSDSMKANFADYAGKTYLSQISSAIKESNQFIAANRETALEEEINKAIRTGQGGSDANLQAVNDLVDSWADLSPQAKEYYKNASKKSIISGDVSQSARLMTDSDGYNDAHDYLKKQYESGAITLDEYDSYDSACYTRYKNNLTKTTQVVSDTFAQSIQQTGVVVDARTAAQAVIDQAPAEMREALTNTLDSAQLGQFYKENTWVNNIATMLPEDLQEKYDEVNEDKTGYFYGMDSTKESVLKTIENQISTNKAKIAEQTDKEYKEQFADFKNDVSLYTNAFNSGWLNGEAYVRSVSASLEKYPLLGGDSQAVSHIMSSINTVIDATIPKAYSDRFKTSITGIVNNCKTLDIEGFDSADFALGVEAKVLDFLYDYGKSELGEKEIQAFLDSLNSDFIKEVMTNMSETNDIKWSGGMSSDRGDFRDYLGLLNTMQTGEMYYIDKSGLELDENGKVIGGETDKGAVRGINSLARNSWTKATEMGEYTLNKIYGEGFVKSSLTEPVVEDGRVTYVPAFLATDGKEYAVLPVTDSSGKTETAVIKSKSGDGSWAVVGNIDSKGIYKESGKPDLNVITGKRTDYGTSSTTPNVYTDKEFETATADAANAGSLDEFVKKETTKKEATPFTKAELTEIYYDPIYKALGEEYDKGEKSAKEIVEDLVEDQVITRQRANEFFRTGEWDSWIDKHNGKAAFATPQTVERVTADPSNMDYPDTSKVTEVLTSDSNPINSVLHRKAEDIQEDVQALEDARKSATTYKDFQKKVKKLNITADEAEAYYFYPIYKVLAKHYEKGAVVDDVLRNAGIDENLIKQFYGNRTDSSPYGKWYNKWKANPESARESIWF